MSTGLDVFDRTLQKANNWVKDVQMELGWEDRHKSYEALRATLMTLRDRLTPDEAADMGAQLPTLVRGVFYEAWDPSGKPVKWNKDEFLAQIKNHFPNDPDVEPERVAMAVFKLLEHRISEGEIKDIRNDLPKGISELWPHPVV